MRIVTTETGVGYGEVWDRDAPLDGIGQPVVADETERGFLLQKGDPRAALIRRDLMTGQAIIRDRSVHRSTNPEEILVTGDADRRFSAHQSRMLR